VYQIFDQSSTRGFKDCFIYPAWQFIQYILPCFVTLIGQHATNSKTKSAELLAYTRFVHNLIQSFELNPTTMDVLGEPGTLTQTRYSEIPDEMWINLAKNLTVQLQEVESELGMLIYGSHKRMKRADTAEVMLGQTFFRLLKETLKSTTLERGEPIMFRCWGNILLQFVPRLREAIRKEILLPTNPFPINNLLQAMSILQELTNIADVCNKPQADLDHIRAILDLANQKVKVMLGKQQNISRGTMDKKQHLGMQKMTVQQLLGSVLFFLALKWDDNMSSFVFATNTFQSEVCKSHDVAMNYAFQGWKELRSALTPYLSDEDGNDISVMTIDFAKKWMVSLHEKVTAFVAEESKLDSDKKEMFSMMLPVVPIKLCRGCIKFEGSEIKLSMCSVCVDNQDYCDIHWFCSKECEEKVLTEEHLEEHDHFLMLKLGLVQF
jgi:hypothetical protein